jgi:hypothetical protein
MLPLGLTLTVTTLRTSTLVDHRNDRFTIAVDELEVLVQRKTDTTGTRKTDASFGYCWQRQDTQ